MSDTTPSVKDQLLKDLAHTASADESDYMRDMAADALAEIERMEREAAFKKVETDAQIEALTLQLDALRSARAVVETPGAVNLRGELWSFLRRVLMQGGDIWLDHRKKSSTEYHIRLDGAARERADELLTLLPVVETTPVRGCIHGSDPTTECEVCYPVETVEPCPPGQLPHHGGEGYKKAGPSDETPAPARAEELAVMFHDTYERLAPKYGYETRGDTKHFNPRSPNGRLMIAVCADLLALERLWSGNAVETPEPVNPELLPCSYPAGDCALSAHVKRLERDLAEAREQRDGMERVGEEYAEKADRLERENADLRKAVDGSRALLREVETPGPSARIGLAEQIEHAKEVITNWPPDVQAAMGLRAETPAQPPSAGTATDPNAPWLTQAHMLCTDMGVPHGQIDFRLRVLRELVTEQPAVTPPASTYLQHAGDCAHKRGLRSLPPRGLVARANRKPSRHGDQHSGKAHGAREPASAAEDDSMSSALKIQRVLCPHCEWYHDEPVSESMLPPGLLACFSDPRGVVDILKRQRIERIQQALLAHLATHATPH